MNYKTEELLIITLAIIIFVAIYTTLGPSITGLIIIEPTFTPNNNIIINETIQLKQHSQAGSTQEIYYYILTYAEKVGKDELQNLIQLDDKALDLEKEVLKIRFNNTLENGDKINFYLKNTNANILNICDFNDSSCNDTIYGSLAYPGVEGFYQTTLTLSESTNEFSVYSVENKTKINYINASHTENQNTTYYYIPSEIESDIIQPENLSKWDIFTVDYTLNNQNINFYYKTDQEYLEFTPPENFSEINLTNLQFKIFLDSDNSSTPVINTLNINYIELTQGTNETNMTQPQNETEPDENQSTPPETTSSGSAPSSTRYKSSTPTRTTQTISPKTETTSQSITFKTSSEPQETQEIIKPNNIRIIGNAVALSYLLFLCLLLYKRKHKL